MVRKRNSRRLKVQRQRKALGLSTWGDFTYSHNRKVKRKMSLKNARYWNSLSSNESPADLGFVCIDSRWAWPQ